LSTPVQAESPPLLVFASVNRGDVVAGDTFTAVVTIYSTSTTPLTPTVTLYAAPGLEPIDPPQPGSAVVWQDQPMVVLARYRVLAGPVAYLTITAVVRDGAGNVAQASTQVRRGRMWIYLPMTQKAP
jgi:hypothetical protein